MDIPLTKLISIQRLISNFFFSVSSAQASQLYRVSVKTAGTLRGLAVHVRNAKRKWSLFQCASVVHFCRDVKKR